MSDERIPIDQLVDLVEGNLPEEEAARLEAILDEGDRRDLAVQAAVKTVLGQLPGPELSDDERRRLRAAVRAELRVEEAGPAPSEGRQEQRSWLVRFIPSAAAAAAVVAMVAVAINLVGGADSVQEATLVDAEMALAEQAIPVTAAPAQAPAAKAPEDSAGSAGPDTTGAPVATAEQVGVAETKATPAADMDPAAELAEAEMAEPAMEEALAEHVEPEAMAETSPAAAEAEEAGGLGPGYIAFEIVTDRAEEAREALEMMETLAAFSEMAPVPVAGLSERAGQAGLVCWQGAAALAGANGVIIWMAPGLVDGVAGEAYLVAPGPDYQPGDGVLALFVYPDCRAVALRAVTDSR